MPLAPAAAGSGVERFADRRDAGRRLARLLVHTRYEDPVVVGVSSDGLPVAAEVARALHAPLAVLLEESPDARHAIERERNQSFDRRGVAVSGRTVIAVDDRLVDARRTHAAVASLRDRGAERVVLAAPFADRKVAQKLRPYVEGLVCVCVGARGLDVEDCFVDYTSPSAAEARALMSEHAGAVAREVVIEVSPGVRLRGELAVPWGAYARGAVAFAGVPGTSRPNPADGTIAAALNSAAIATLRVHPPLLSSEQATNGLVGDSDLLAARLVAMTRWLRCQPETAGLALGCFGSGAGGVAALLAAARLKAGACAVVSCAARVGVARELLRQVLAPALLIVGDGDAELLEDNRLARQQLRCESTLVELGGADVYGEPTALEDIARLTAAWFTSHLNEPAPALDADTG